MRVALALSLVSGTAPSEWHHSGRSSGAPRADAPPATAPPADIFPSREVDISPTRSTSPTPALFLAS